MNKEEAIKILKGAIKKPNTQDGYLGQALTMGIEALENQKTGHWIEKNVNQDGTHNIYCSNCNNYLKFKGHANSYNARTKLKYCSYCGAKMEQEQTEKLCCNCTHNKESEPTIENCATCHGQNNFTPKPEGE